LCKKGGNKISEAIVARRLVKGKGGKVKGKSDEKDQKKKEE